MRSRDIEVRKPAATNQWGTCCPCTAGRTRFKEAAPPAHGATHTREEMAQLGPWAIRHSFTHFTQLPVPGPQQMFHQLCLEHQPRRLSLSRGLQNPKVRPHSPPTGRPSGLPGVLNILSLSVSAQEIPVGRQEDLAGPGVKVHQ